MENRCLTTICRNLPNLRASACESVKYCFRLALLLNCVPLANYSILLNLSFLISTVEIQPKTFITSILHLRHCSRHSISSRQKNDRQNK